MRKKKVKPATVVSYVILTIFALIVLVPFIWFVSTSFDYVKSYSLRFPPRLIPKEFSITLIVKNSPRVNNIA